MTKIRRKDASPSSVPAARASFLEANARRLVVMLCVLAAVRVFVFAAAFPFFNNVDEQSHFDLVVKYSHGHLPRGLEPFCAEAARYIVLCGSPEYLTGSEPIDSQHAPRPAWGVPRERLESELRARGAEWQAATNTESPQAPLYYALAGAWLRFGRVCGLEDVALVYWVRFLDLPLIAAMVWIAAAAARMVFPRRPSLNLGVPLLVAFFPQDAFYSIQNDVLSPVCFGAAMLCVLKLLASDTLGLRLGLATGLAFAATFLTKMSNLPLLAVAALVVLIAAWRHLRVGSLRASWPAWSALALSATLPVVGWLAWSRFAFGDFGASELKVRALGWTPKPLDTWWPHPIFGLQGMHEFASELGATFWRGEFVWYLRRLASPTVDSFYWLSSLVLIAAAAVGVARRSSTSSGEQRRALSICLCVVASSIAFLGVLSVAFDFGNCFYPSREHPFFISGRLLSGALIPFLMLYAFGLDTLLGRVRAEWPRWMLLALIVSVATVSEISLNRPAFSSAFNWFHRPG